VPKKSNKTGSGDASEVTLMSLEDYLAETSVNMGLVASFKHEALSKPALLNPKSKTAWDIAFTTQANKQYK
jgi:hypothetical protein